MSICDTTDGSVVFVFWHWHTLVRPLSVVAPLMMLALAQWPLRRRRAQHRHSSPTALHQPLLAALRSRPCTHGHRCTGPSCYVLMASNGPLSGPEGADNQRSAQASGPGLASAANAAADLVSSVKDAVEGTFAKVFPPKGPAERPGRGSAVDAPEELSEEAIQRVADNVREFGAALADVIEEEVALKIGADPNRLRRERQDLRERLEADLQTLASGALGPQKVLAGVNGLVASEMRKVIGKEYEFGDLSREVESRVLKVLTGADVTGALAGAAQPVGPLPADERLSLRQAAQRVIALRVRQGTQLVNVAVRGAPTRARQGVRMVQGLWGWGLGTVGNAVGPKDKGTELQLGYALGRRVGVALGILLLRGWVFVVGVLTGVFLGLPMGLWKVISKGKVGKGMGSKGEDQDMPFRELEDLLLIWEDWAALEPEP